MNILDCKSNDIESLHVKKP